VPLFVRRWGRRGGTPLLFLHSLGPASSAAFLGLAAGPLEEAGYDVAAPDLPGYGGSPPVDPDAYAVPVLAELVARVPGAGAGGGVARGGARACAGGGGSRWSATAGAAPSPATWQRRTPSGFARWSWWTAVISTTP